MHKHFEHGWMEVIKYEGWPFVFDPSEEIITICGVSIRHWQCAQSYVDPPESRLFELSYIYLNNKPQSFIIQGKGCCLPAKMEQLKLRE